MTIDNLEIQIKSSSEQASQGINKLAASLTTLKQVAKSGAGLGTVANQISKLNTALAGITAPTAKIQSMVNAINRLSSVSTKASTKSEGLASVVKQLNKLPKVAQALKATDMDGFATAINRVTTAIKPLATEMEKVSNGFSALPTRIQKVITQNERLTASNRKTGKSYGILGTGVQGWAARLMTATFTARAIGNVIGGWIQKSNAYVENLNLFTVALGDYAEEAKDYAETVGELMGIDPSDWLRAQGIFNTLATGFGITSDKAAIMSKNLTQLSYDLSSFYNINVSDAMTKLQSAFSGELEPVRRLGYDLSQTKLQAIAASKGITKNIADMNQAEKSMIRYHALMTQVTTAQGDMARTLNAPSNQLRIFNAQIAQAQRALGNIFIPALNAVLPYLIAFLKVLRDLANELASFFGYQLPEIDYSNVNEIGSGVSDNLDSATESAKKLKNAVGGFDELNILSQDNGNGDGNGLGASFDLEPEQYNFLEGLTESKSNEIAEKLKKPFEEILKLAAKIGVAIAAWKVGNGIYNFATELNNIKPEQLKNLKMAAGVVLSITGFAMEFEGFKAIGKGDAELLDYVKAAVGSALGLAGSLLVFGTGVLGWTIGITAAIAIAIVGMSVGVNEDIEQKVKDHFYEYEQGAIDIEILSGHFETLIDNIAATDQPLIDGGTRIDEFATKAGNASDEIEAISTALQYNVTTADVNIPKLNEKFQELATSTKGIMDETYNNIIRAVSGSLNKALEDAGVDVPLIIAEISKIKGETEETYNTIMKKFEELSKKYSDGKIPIEEYTTKIMELTTKLNEISGATDPVTESFGKVRDLFSTKINWGSEEAKNNAFETLKNSATTAQTQINESYAQIVEDVNRLKSMGLGEDAANAILESALDVKGEREKQLQGYVSEFSNIIQTELVSGMEDAFTAAKDDYQNASWFTKFLHTEEDYMTRQLGEYKTGFIEPISKELEELLKGVGADGEVWATDVSEKIWTGIFEYKADTVGEERNFGAYLQTAIKDELDKIDVSGKTNEVGKNVVEGLSNGITDNAETAKTAMRSILDEESGLILVTRETLKTHSPSKVFEDIGLNIDEGLANGITNNTDLVTTSMTTMLNTLTEKFETFTNRLRNALNSMLSDFARSMSTMRIDEDGEVTYKRIEAKKIERFATGGFPTTGSMFIANEAGPELVGRIGTRTAVANQDQITEGIAQAVYNAMMSANQSGGNQNINLFIDGKQVNAAVEKAKREKGTSIMTGGLIYG